MNVSKCFTGVLLCLFLLLLIGCNVEQIEATPTAESLPFIITKPTPVTQTASWEENWASLCNQNENLVIARSVEETGAVFVYAVGILYSNGVTFKQLSPKGVEYEYVKPDWSRDCSMVAFERLEGQLTNVYIMDADGENFRQAIDTLPANLHPLAPSWSETSNRLVVTISNCTDCVPEDTYSNSMFGVVNIDNGGTTHVFDTSPAQGWGFMHNASFAGSDDAIIFNAKIGEYNQIAAASDILSQAPTWVQLTAEPYEHFMPVWLESGSFIYSAANAGEFSIMLFHKGASYNLTREFAMCKDPDAKKTEYGYSIVATCNTETQVTDFLQWELELR